MPEATAVPAAPSPSAPAAPAQPAPDAGASAAAAQPDKPSAPAARKPLAPIRTLPGVFPDGDPFPSPPPDRPPDGDATSAPQRGPDGRFVAATSSAAPSGEHTLKPAEATPPAPVSKFKFAGEEFESQEAAEQNFKTLRGQYKPLQALARSLGGVDKVVPQFTQAAESARAWKAEHDRVKAELDTIRSGGKQPAAAAAPAPDAAEQPDVDWELYAEVKKLATESGEPWKAEQWLIAQVREADQTRYQKMLDERLAPLDAQQEQQAVATRTETLFTSLAGYTNADGSPAFPELSDEKAAFEIGRLWASLGLPRESALTPQGAMAAIGLYRLAKGGSQAKQAPAAPPAAAPAAPAVPTDAESAAGLTDGRPTVASVPGNGSAPSAEAARILAGLRQANKGTRAALGFDA